MPSKRKPKPEAEPILNADPLMSRGVIVTHPEKHITPGNASIVWLIVMMAIIGGVGAICTTIWWQKEDLTAQIEAPYMHDNNRFLSRFVRDVRTRMTAQPIGDQWGGLVQTRSLTMPYPQNWHVYAFEDLFSSRVGLNPTPIVEGYEGFTPSYAIAFTSTIDPEILKSGLIAFIDKERVHLVNTKLERVLTTNGFLAYKLSGEWMPATEELADEQPFYRANQSKTIYFIADKEENPRLIITGRVSPDYVVEQDEREGRYRINPEYEAILEELIMIGVPK